MTNTRQLDQTILREYDIRGIVGDTLNPDDVRAIGHGFGTFVVRDGGKSVAVGYDGRLSSPELEAAVVGGLCAAGLHVHRVGRGPSPMLYQATHVLEADAGLMITGYHNPPDYNGIKMSLGGKSFLVKTSRNSESWSPPGILKMQKAHMKAARSSKITSPACKATIRVQKN